MTPEKIHEVLDRYVVVINSLPKGLISNNLMHVLEMTTQLREFLDATPPRWDKANRWLGFIQGVLWAEKFYTIEEMKNHNRPNDS